MKVEDLFFEWLKDNVHVRRNICKFKMLWEKFIHEKMDGWEYLGLISSTMAKRIANSKRYKYKLIDTGIKTNRGSKLVGLFKQKKGLKVER